MAIDTSVAQIMTTDVIFVGPDAEIPEIARLLWENRISGMPVVEDGRVIGMITEYDLITRESDYEGPLYIPFLDAYFRVPGTGDETQVRKILATTARQLMTAPAIVAAPDTTVQDVATLMYERRLNAIPVVEADDRLLGIVSRSDIVRLMVADEASYDAAHGEQV